ncbi:hypothetical protein [Chryseolinea soli]|nr:hypothetical protein [Chryseolinea soli]
MKKLALGCLLLSYLSAFSQANEGTSLRVYGVVIDSIYQLPISDVHVSTKRYGTITADNGIFSLLLSSGDSLYFSHVNYKPFVFVYYAGIHNHLKIALIPKVRILREVKVFPFDTEEAFKTKLLEGDAVESHDVEVAKENSAKLKGLGAYAPPPSLDILGRFEAGLEGPQGVTFFSSKSGKGIFEIIKGPKNHDASYRPPKVKDSTPVKFNTLKANTLKIDSVKRDSVKSKGPKPLD